CTHAIRSDLILHRFALRVMDRPLPVFGAHEACSYFFLRSVGTPTQTPPTAPTEPESGECRMSPGDWGSGERRRNRQLTVQSPRDQWSHRMVLYACSPGGSHICLRPFANVA